MGMRAVQVLLLYSPNLKLGLEIFNLICGPERWRRVMCSSSRHGNW